MPFLIIPFLLLIIPITEIAVFILVGGQIGVFPTLAMILITAILGTFFLRQQGLSILHKLQEESRAGHIPGRELIHGAMIVIAGVLLLTPGFVTDSIGFLLFFPPFRDLTWNFMKNKINIVNQNSTQPFSNRNNPHNKSHHSDDKPHIDLTQDEYSHIQNSDSMLTNKSPWTDRENKQK